MPKTEAYIKTVQTIESCRNLQHIAVVEKMVHLYYDMFKDDADHFSLMCRINRVADRIKLFKEV